MYHFEVIQIDGAMAFTGRTIRRRRRWAWHLYYNALKKCGAKMVSKARNDLDIIETMMFPSPSYQSAILSVPCLSWFSRPSSAEYAPSFLP